MWKFQWQSQECLLMKILRDSLHLVIKAIIPLNFINLSIIFKRHSCIEKMILYPLYDTMMMLAKIAASALPHLFPYRRWYSFCNLHCAIYCLVSELITAFFIVVDLFVQIDLRFFDEFPWENEAQCNMRAYIGKEHAWRDNLVVKLQNINYN